ncbi:MAG: Ig-like domain-containing protein [Paludibacteraceae bacterium]|nr:Ig-like domain-containing protein [Paludibacteraceae bacterium]
MKKFFLLPLLLTATMVFADDAVLVESFSKVGNVATGTYTWTGDLCTWSAFMTARRKQDTIHTANQTQAIWMSISNAGAAKVSTTNFEGGIKNVAFKYARYGKETSPAGRILQLKVKVGETENSTPTFAGNAMKLGNGATADHEVYTYAFNSKSNAAQLSIENISTCTEDLTTTGICRICVGDITITPYLLYTTKEVTLDLRLGSNKITNAGLINNTDEGAIVYSISDNTIGATIDAATGEVTASQAGEVTVTASWEAITTSYTLTILAKDVATASFDNSKVLAKLGEAAPHNTFTTNSNADVEFSSSDENVATIDNAGHVTLVGVGTATITANVLENATYTSASATYTLRVVPANFKIETFDSATETSSTYATSKVSAAGDICSWSFLLGGIKTMSDATFVPMFGTTKYALFRAPKENEDVPYIESDSIEGGIEYLAFDANPLATETGTTWDIRVFINGVQVGNNLTSFPAYPQNEWSRINIQNINISGKFVIRFENHTTIGGEYPTTNKGRLAIDNIEWTTYESTPSAIDNTNVQREIRKEMINGQLIINIDGVRYNMQGQQL